jgi:predicted transcriptional regulator of viral defense system
MKAKAHTFFFEHKVFTFEEFAEAMGNPLSTCHIMLNQHLKNGNIVRIKQGLYASIPSGADAENYPIDPYSIIGVLADDTLITYHTALEFHGIAYSMHFQHIFQTSKKIRPFQFRQDRFKITQYPRSLPKSKRFIFTEQIDHHGTQIRVTQIERTLVDVLDRINLSGGLEEVWRSLNNIKEVNVAHIIEYTLLLNNTTTIAKVGHYLRLRQKDWNIDETYFLQLKKNLPKSALYLRKEHRTNGRFIKEWNLIIPQELANEEWEDTPNQTDI